MMLFGWLFSSSKELSRQKKIGPNSHILVLWTLVFNEHNQENKKEKSHKS